MFKNIKHVVLDVPSPLCNGAPDPSEFDPYIAPYKEIKAKLEAGERVYVGYKDGERAGSIAYIKEVSPEALDHIVKEPYSAASFHLEPRYVCHLGFHAKVGWDKRRNVIQAYIGHGLVYFPDYEGPTVWEKFDKKAAEKEATADTVVIDRDGNVINVGDRVLYINARYGGAAQLDRGTITDIRVKVRKYRNDTYADLNVYIDNDEGEKSKITGPDKSVLKI